MPSMLDNILRQKLVEIQSSLPPFVKIVKDRGESFESVLASELEESNSVSSDISGISSEYMRYVEEASRKYNISSTIIKEVIKAESGGNPNAVSKAGAMGLMQLMPETAKALGVKNVFDPAENINGGVKYLRDMLKEFGGNLELALAAYNAGPNNVKKYGGIPPFSETQNYVAKIMSGLKNKK